MALDVSTHEKWLDHNLWPMRLVGAWSSSGGRARPGLSALVLAMSAASLAVSAKRLACDGRSMTEAVNVLCSVVLHLNAIIGNIMLLSNKPRLLGLCDVLERNYRSFARDLEDCEPAEVRRKMKRVPIGFFVFGQVCGAASAVVYLLRSHAGALLTAGLVYEAAEHVLVFFVNLTVDMLLLTLMQYAAHQLRLLGRLVATAVSCPDAPERLRTCVSMHCSIRGYAAQLEAMMSVPMIFHFLLLTFMLCLNMFQLAAKIDSNENILENTSNIMTALAVLFMYCKLGEELKTWSEKLRAAVCDSRWLECSTPVKKTILMILIHCQAPIVLRAGPFYTVTLDTFLKVFNGSYTYFTIMRQMQH